MRELLRYLMRGLTAVLVLALLWAAGFIWYAVTLPEGVDDPDSRTDAIVVLTGGSERVATGLDLLAAGKADKLFVSGVHRSVELAELLRLTKSSGAELDGRVVLGYSAGNTVGNAVETAIWMRGQGYKSLRVVTGSYHMRRSLLEFRHAMPEAVLVPHPVFPENVKADQWWLWPGTAMLIASEYTKFLAASLLHGLEPSKEWAP